MGKWVYMDDETNKSAQVLKKMANRLMTASMKSKTDINVEFQQRSKELKQPTVSMTFFKDGDNFTITLYSFYAVEKNTKFLDCALALMKDSNKYEEIKKQVHDERFN